MRTIIIGDIHGCAAELKALLKLPAELREIIVLRYYDGIPLTEIAIKMNLSYGAVKLRHAKVLQQIRKNMAEYPA